MRSAPTSSRVGRRPDPRSFPATRPAVERPRAIFVSGETPWLFRQFGRRHESESEAGTDLSLCGRERALRGSILSRSPEAFP